MYNYDEQRNEIRERNEKNKEYHKRMKIYFIGLIAPWVVFFALFGLIYVLVEGNVLSIRGEELANIFVFIVVITLIVWFSWIIYGIFLTRCPHCGAFLYYVRGKMYYCPHCGTTMEVYPDFEDKKM